MPKTASELFSELVRLTTFPVFHKDGEFKKIGNTEFMESVLDINHRQFKKFLMFGIKVSDMDKSFFKKLVDLANDFDINPTKPRSEVFDRNTFNLKSFLSFFGKRRIGKGDLYSKAQIYSVMNSGYIIPQYNFAVRDNKFKSIKSKMFKEIDRIVKQWQSLNFFYFNFLIVDKYLQKEF